MRTRWFGAAAVVSVMVAGAQVASAQVRSAIDIRSAGLRALLPSPKDQGVLEALELLPDRIAELPEEIPDFPVEATPLALLAFEVLRSPMSVGIDLDEATGQPVALVSFSPEGGDADAVLERLAGVLIDSGAPLERAGGGFTLESPAGPVLMRSLGGRHLSISLGDLPAAPPRAPDRTMFVDARAAFSFSLDFAKLAPVAGMAAGQAPPEATAALEEAGLIGQDAMRIDFAMGHSDDAAHEIVRLTGRRGPWTELGLLQADPLTAADFRAVPRNAASVAAVALDLSAVVGLVDMITEATGEDPLALVREQIGIDLRGDLFPHLGDRIVSYNTGGPAGFLGTVAMVEIDNPAAFLETHAQIVDLINELGSEQARGYVEIASIDLGRYGGTGAAFTARFPGLPVPAAPAWTVRDGMLVMTASPLTLATALEHLNGARGGSIAQDADFLDAIENRLDGSISVSYHSTQEMATMGVPAVASMAAAIENMVRSPHGDDREPPVIARDFAAIADDVQPIGWTAKWEGDDLVVRARFDRSLLSNLATILNPSQLQQIASASTLAGILLPALDQARISARRVQSSALMRQAGVGATMYAAENDGRLPGELRLIVEAGILEPEVFESPFGPMEDGLPDIILRTDLGGQKNPYEFRPDVVLGIDRAMLYNDPELTNVLFMDMSVRSIDWWELEEIFARPENRGAVDGFGIADWFDF